MSSLILFYPFNWCSLNLFLRISEVLQMTGMGKTFIYDRMRDGTFPKQIQLGSRTVIWNEQEVTKWMADRMASR